MGWNGAGGVVRTDGTRTGSDTWEQARDADVKILAAAHDTHDQDLAEAIARTLNIDGENSPAADIDWGGQKITNLGAGTARLHAARLAQVQDGTVHWGGTSGGSANAQTISLSPNLTGGYETGLTIRYIAGSTNTSDGPTLNANGQGAKTLVTRGGGTIRPGWMVAGQEYEVVYDGTNLRVQRGFSRLVAITSSTTYNKPAGLLAVRLRCQAGGGGGGGSAATSGSENAAAGGGGGGEYAEGMFAANQIGSSTTVTVGAGGTAGSSGANAGGDGGTSSFGANITALGGSGGAGGAASSSGNLTAGGGAGGTGGSGGSFRIPGGRGGAGHVAGGARHISADGGGSFLGNPTGAGVGGGNAGALYGGGASGSNRTASQSAIAGQAGGAGIVIVEEFY